MFREHIALAPVVDEVPGPEANRPGLGLTPYGAPCLWYLVATLSPQAVAGEGNGYCPLTPTSPGSTPPDH